MSTPTLITMTAKEEATVRYCLNDTAVGRAALMEIDALRAKLHVETERAEKAERDLEVCRVARIGWTHASDVAHREIDRLIQERDGWQAGVDAWREQVEQLTQERDDLKAALTRILETR